MGDFSQNAQQALDNTFAYTKYAQLGRIRETGPGQFNSSGIPYAGWEALEADADNIFTGDKTKDLEDRFPATSLSTGVTQQTITSYSKNSGIMVNGMAQRYLQNCVSHTQHHNPDNTVVTNYYSYDPHGNVEWMVQDIPLLGRKSISYEYDLISGNVTRVAYNKGKADQFYHRYSYDEDNRIKSVQTSDNGNLTTLMRQTTTGAVMDNLSYHYMTKNGSPTNKLESVNDDVSETTFTDDIDNQSSGNYRYDAIGNLVSDASENINQITWTATGKVSKIEKADGEATTFLYDAGGNRVEKLHTTTGGITTATYYVRDARGNIMATYKGTDVDAADGSTGKDRLITLSVIVNLLKSGHDLRLVQTFAGHKYPSATEKYRQTGIGELKAGIEKYHPLK